MTWARSQGCISDAEGRGPWVGVQRIPRGSMLQTTLEPALQSSSLCSALSGLRVDPSFFFWVGLHPLSGLVVRAGWGTIAAVWLESPP